MFFQRWTLPFRKEDRELKKVREVRQKFEQEWLKIEGVSSIGIGKEGSSYAIVISYSTNETYIRTNIPALVEGIPIIFTYSGEITIH